MYAKILATIKIDDCISSASALAKLASMSDAEFRKNVEIIESSVFHESHSCINCMTGTVRKTRKGDIICDCIYNGTIIESDFSSKSEECPYYEQIARDDMVIG